MNKTISIIIIILIILGVGYFVMGKKTAVAPENNDDMSGMEHGTSTTPTASTATSSAPQVTSTSTTATTTGQVKVIVVNGNNFSFAPAAITVKKGERVRLVLKNTGGFHDLVIDEYKVATKKINGDQEDAVEFVADKVGSFEYYCSVGTHRQMGMKGTLTVTE